MLIVGKILNNIRVYELAESIFASGYPMLSNVPSTKEFEEEVEYILTCIGNKDYSNKHIKRAIKLANAKGDGHNQFLTGILVSFDMSFTNKGWVESERYKYLNFVSSQSTMHRISKMDLKKCCSENVDERIIDIVNEKIDKYNETKSIEDYRELLDNLPSGLILTARMTTNYRCLKNIYGQRHNHRLKVWLDFCEEIKRLPMSKELIVGDI